MGGKGSKGEPGCPKGKAKKPGSGSPVPRLLPELDPGAEVEVVSQLSALALLKQELAQLQAAAELEAKADPSPNKKRKQKRKTRSLRLATLSRYIGTWADVTQKLEDRVPSAAAAQQESAHFARMPPELVCEVLSFLDYTSLLAFGQTSVWSYGAVHHSSGALVSAKLVDHVHAVRGPGLAHLLGALPLEAPCGRRPILTDSSASSLSASASDISVSGSDEEDDGEAAAATTGKPQAAETPSRAAIAARLLVVPALLANATCLTPRDAEMFEDVFEPGVSQNMKAFASVRTFRIPTALYALRGGVGIAIAEGLANVEVQLASTQGVHNSDAWTRRPLRFGPELVPISSIEQFDEMFQSLREVRWLSTELVTVNLPSAGDALKAVARLAGSHELLMWKDTQFKGSGLGGHRFLVVGGSQAAVVQWEYYSNFCGGPYATYSCGMG